MFAISRTRDRRPAQTRCRRATFENLEPRTMLDGWGLPDQQVTIEARFITLKDDFFEPFDLGSSEAVGSQDGHQEIVDQLEQLRRSQDQQVTIEARFITPNDDCFEQIGLDIEDNIDWLGSNDTKPGQNTPDVDNGGSVTDGQQAPHVFSADPDIPFTQGGFGLTGPRFGGFDAAAGAHLGFATLSDIEAFFLINATLGERPGNVLQAPKVTLFNGQQAFISARSQTPITEVTPVAEELPAAQPSVIQELSEATSLIIEVVVSQDQRFMQLTLVPWSSKIEEFDTFDFDYGQTTTVDTSGDDKDETTSQDTTFSLFTVTTTVSVPDGGTVLLGGNESGEPLWDKIPYVDRLFKNIGIGREEKTLLILVKPRIIIQE